MVLLLMVLGVFTFHIHCASADAAPIGIDTLAVTGRLGKANELPSQAGTLFVNGKWNVNGQDLVGIAEHELTHAIGFDESYSMFKSHLFADAEDAFVRDFRVTANDAKGRILGILTAAPSTHLDIGDPIIGGGFKGRVVNGFQQNDDLMRPLYQADLRIGQQDKNILDAAFDWSTINGGGLKIILDFVDPDNFTADEKKALAMAVADVRKLFAPAKGAPNNIFTWRVAEQVFWPPTLVLVPTGIVLLAHARTPRRRPTGATGRSRQDRTRTTEEAVVHQPTPSCSLIEGHRGVSQERSTLSNDWCEFRKMPTCEHT